MTGNSRGREYRGRRRSHLRDVIHSLDDPIYAEGATAVLNGNLAPRGCVMKPAAADQRFLKHRGQALAFEDYNHMAREVERDDLDGHARPRHRAQERRPQGRPRHAGMGHAADPQEAGSGGRARHGAHLGRTHERHQLRRLHPACGAGELRRRAAGIRAAPATRSRSTSPARRIHLHVGEEELARRRAAWKPPPPRYARGYGAMFSAHIGQADEGCDFDFLAGAGQIPEPEIH